LQSKAPLPELRWHQQTQPVLPKHQWVLETPQRGLLPTLLPSAGRYAVISQASRTP